MNISSTKQIFAIIVSLILLSSCGVSDYINRKKITNAIVKLKPAKEKATTTSSKCDDNELRSLRIVKYVNRVRSNMQQCGDKPYRAAQAINWNSKLLAAAKVHSQDMADSNLFSHTGSDHSSTGTRVNNAGYDWKAVAENISAGTDTPEQTIDRWMASPEHCHNIMNPIYTEIGLACAMNSTSEYEIYWTLVLATESK